MKYKQTSEKLNYKCGTIPCIGTKTVLGILGLTENALYVRMQKNQFPKPAGKIKGKNAWRVADVDVWLDNNKPDPSMKSTTYDKIMMYNRPLEFIDQ